jgi:hypothetical protein
MESAEVELVDESPDPTNEVPKLSGADLARPGRMPTGTLTPPLPTSEGDGLDALRTQAQVQHAAQAWDELALTLRAIIDLGNLQVVIGV